MLTKCKEVYGEEELKNAEFYIAGSRGTVVHDTILLDSDESDREITWTLMSLSYKYPSKARFSWIQTQVSEDVLAARLDPHIVHVTYIFSCSHYQLIMWLH